MELNTLEVAGFMPAITQAMRNPLNSWANSDSFMDDGGNFCLGDADRKLAQQLICAGTEHAKFMRQIQVWVNITAPIYWWSEFDTYKVGVVRNSCSTMHKLIHTIQALNKDEEFTAWRCSLTPVPGHKPLPTPKCVLQLFQTPAGGDCDLDVSTYVGQTVLFMYDLLHAENKLFALQQLKRVLPSTWLQKSTVTLSYQAINTMVMQRRNHRLPEWSDTFIAWVKTLPYAEELIFFNIDRGEATI